MSNDPAEFLVEFIYDPSPDAAERLAQAWALILSLILEDYEKEQKSNSERKR